MSEKNSIQKKRKDLLEAIKLEKRRQVSSVKATKEMRRLTYSYHYRLISYLHAMLRAHTSCSPSCSQEQIKQIEVRFEEFDKLVSQMSSSPTPQRKLLRLKNSPNKRDGMERVHTKSKTRNNKNKQTVLQPKAPRARRKIK